MALFFGVLFLHLHFMSELNCYLLLCVCVCKREREREREDVMMYICIHMLGWMDDFC